jgi:hypothetical protein
MRKGLWIEIAFSIYALIGYSLFSIGVIQFQAVPVLFIPFLLSHVYYLFRPHTKVRWDKLFHVMAAGALAFAIVVMLYLGYLRG